MLRMVAHKHNPPFRLLLSLAASMVISMLGLILTRHFAPLSWLRANNDVAGNYLQTVGTIYAVLLAFVVFVVWQQHNDARGAVEAEANELSDLYRTLKALPGTERARECAQAYGRAVVVQEWAAMARRHPSPEAELALEAIWQALQDIEVGAGRQEVLYAEVMGRFNDLSDARSRRLYCTLLRVPRSLWVLLFTNGGLVVGSMWLFGLKSFLAHAIMTVALAVSIAFILFLVADLDNPFWGSWQIGPEAFERVLAEKPPAEARAPAGGASDISH